MSVESGARLILRRSIFISSSPGRQGASYFSAGDNCCRVSIIEIAPRNRRVVPREDRGKLVLLLSLSLPPFPLLFLLAILDSLLIAHGLARSPVIERAPLFLSPSHLSASCTCNRYIHLFFIRSRRVTPNRFRVSSSLPAICDGDIQ